MTSKTISTLIHGYSFARERHEPDHYVHGYDHGVQRHRLGGGLWRRITSRRVPVLNLGKVGDANLPLWHRPPGWCDDHQRQRHRHDRLDRRIVGRNQDFRQSGFHHQLRHDPRRPESRSLGRGRRGHQRLRGRQDRPHRHPRILRGRHRRRRRQGHELRHDSRPGQPVRRRQRSRIRLRARSSTGMRSTSPAGLERSPTLARLPGWCASLRDKSSTAAQAITRRRSRGGVANMASTSGLGL